ncbi:MAG: CoA pyrophosphatase [Pseudomonadota bacterium]
MTDDTRPFAPSQLRAQLQTRLAAFPRQAATDAGTPAAVVLGVTELGYGADVAGLPRYADWQRAPALLLTRRAATLRRHAGQWALPGGRLDPGETLAEAALRELREEVGLALDAGALLGQLDDFVTASGFVMTPFVAWLGAARDLQPAPAEVASIHRIPLTELQRKDAPRLSPISDSEHPVLRMPIGADSIAAPTAALLYQFEQVLLAGVPTRVAHYAQPHFARR